MTFHRRGLLACGVALVLVGAAACGSDDGGTSDEGGSDENVTITVMGMPAAGNDAGRAAFTTLVEEFEAANPNINVEPSDAPWDVKTFATKLAGGNAETVLKIPLTEPAGLIERGQVADITAEAEELEAFDALDPKIMEMLTRDGKVYALPESVYTLGLVYNRTLFTEAGLDPDDPPATWDDFRAAAKQITERTGKIGYAALTTNNGGGWHLTALTYSNGGTVQEVVDGTATATFNDAPMREALELLHAMRFEDNSMGVEQLRKAEDLAPQFAAGEVGMQINGTAAYNSFVNRFGGNPDDFGIAGLPQGGGSGTLAGGTVMMVNAKASDAERAAAVKWIDFSEIRPVYDADAAVAEAEALAADGAPVGIPQLPIFDQETVDTIDAAIEPHVNVPVEQFAPYMERDKDLEFVLEPAVAAQDVYAALDPVLQAVLTEEDADPAALLADAEEQVNAILARQ